MMIKKVVVIGGGYAGVNAAKACDRRFDVTLIAGRDAFHHTVGGLRASVVKGYDARLCPSYDNLLRHGRVLRLSAIRINPGVQKVTLSTDEEIPYDILILATGSLHSKTVGIAGCKDTQDERTGILEQACTEVAEATSVLVVGGGPVGIEFAGEVKEQYPDKEMTLVTAKELMPSPEGSYSEKFRARLKAKLESVGVVVHTGAGRVNFDVTDVDPCGFIPGKKMYRWSSGEVEADLCVVAIGARQTSSLYRDSGLEHWLDERGMVKVESTFEVKGAAGTAKVFAIGDCADLAIPKLAYAAGLCGDVIIKNITASANGNPLLDIAPSAPNMCSVPVGSRGGVTLSPLGVMGDNTTRLMKAKGLLCGRFWSELHAGKPPIVP